MPVLGNKYALHRLSAWKYYHSTSSSVGVENKCTVYHLVSQREPKTAFHTITSICKSCGCGIIDTIWNSKFGVGTAECRRTSFQMAIIERYIHLPSDLQWSIYLIRLFVKQKVAAFLRVWEGKPEWCSSKQDAWSTETKVSITFGVDVGDTLLGTKIHDTWAHLTFHFGITSKTVCTVTSSRH